MKLLEFDKTRDFPYYNHNPRISKAGWLVLLLTVPISLILYLIIGSSNEMIGSIVFCLFMLIPLLYFSKWDYGLLFHKPTKNEIILAVLLFVGYIIYAIAMEYALELLGFSGNDPPLEVTAISTFSLIFSMMGEELLKFIPLMFFMRLFYKITDKRNLSLAVSSVIVLTFFGLIHYDYSSPIIMCLLIQGLGSVFELYGYIRTKNLFVPYMTHLLTDAFIFIMILLNI